VAYFRVEGTSRVRWSLLVEAASEDEASAIARRTAGIQSELRREDALQEVQHQVGPPSSLAVEGPKNGRHSAYGDEAGRSRTGRPND
jgi:hypothetical protein